MISLTTVLLLLVGTGVVAIGVGYYLRLIISLGKKGSMELEIKQMMLDTELRAKKIIEESESKAETKAKEVSIELKEKEREFKPGDVMWVPAQAHIGENIGNPVTHDSDPRRAGIEQRAAKNHRRWIRQ